MAIALGIGLSVATDWVRRRDPPQPGDAADAASYVPQALAAAARAMVFAAIYRRMRFIDWFRAALPRCSPPLPAASACGT